MTIILIQNQHKHHHHHQHGHHHHHNVMEFNDMNHNHHQNDDYKKINLDNIIITGCNNNNNNDDTGIDHHNNYKNNEFITNKTTNDDPDNQNDLPGIYFEIYDLDKDIQRPITTTSSTLAIPNNSKQRTNYNRRRRLRYTSWDVYPLPSSSSSLNNENNQKSKPTILSLGTTSGSVYLFYRTFQSFLNEKNIYKQQNTIKIKENDLISPSPSISSITSSSSSSNLLMIKQQQQQQYNNDILDNPSQKNSSSSSSSYYWSHYTTIIANDIVGIIKTIHFFQISIQLSLNYYSDSFKSSTGSFISNTTDNDGSILFEHQQQQQQQQQYYHYYNDDNFRSNINNNVDDNDDNNHHHHHHHRPLNHRNILNNNIIVTNNNGNNNNNNKHHLILSLGTTKGHLILVKIFEPKMSSEEYNNNNDDDDDDDDLSINFNDKIKITTTPASASAMSNTNHTFHIIYHCREMTTEPINMIRFDEFGNRLFIADTSGKLFILSNVNELIINSITNNTTSNSINHMHKCPTILINLNGIGINQFDICEKYFIFSSNENRIYFFNFYDANCFQVGKSIVQMNKPPGVCIIPIINYDENENDDEDDNDDNDNDDQSSTISNDNILYKTFISRPKFRLWEVNEIGQIEYTHQFMDLVNSSLDNDNDNDDNNTTPILNDNTDIFNQKDSPNNYKQQQQNYEKIHSFGKLYLMYHPISCDYYLVTYTTTTTTTTLIESKNIYKSRIYIIDIHDQSLVAISQQFDGQIDELKCLQNEIYISYYRTNDTTNRLQMFIMTLNIKKDSDHDITSSSSSSSSSLLSIDIATQNSAIISSGFSSDPNNVEQETFIINEKEIIPESSLIINKQLLNLYDQLLWKTTRTKLRSSTLHNNNHDDNDDFDAYNCVYCGLPIAKYFQNIDLLNSSNKLIFESIYSNIDNEHYEELISISKSKQNWLMYIQLLFALPKLDDRFLFISTLIDDDDDSFKLIEQQRIKSIDNIIHWKNCLINLFNELKSSNQLNNDNMIEHSNHRCRLCSLRLQNNNDNDNIDKWIEFFEKFFISIHLHYHSDDHNIINELIIIILKLFDINPKQSYKLSIDLYIKILYFQIMDSSINNDIRLLINKLSQKQINKNYDLDPEKNSEKNTKKFLKQILETLEPSLKPDKNEKNFKMNNYKNNGMILNLSKIRCNKCNKLLLLSSSSNNNNENGNVKIRKKLKIFPNCHHIYHGECLTIINGNEYCSLCVYHPKKKCNLLN